MVDCLPGMCKAGPGFNTQPKENKAEFWIRTLWYFGFKVHHPLWLLLMSPTQIPPPPPSPLPCSHQYHLMLKALLLSGSSPVLKHYYVKFFLSTWWGPSGSSGPLCSPGDRRRHPSFSACRGKAKSPERQGFDVQDPQPGTRNDETETR